MACGDITTGRARQCKGLGGTSKLYLFNYVQDPFTVDAGEATAINPLLTAVFEFDLVGDGHPFAENMVGDRNTSTAINTQTITAILPKQDATSSVNLTELTKGYSQAVVLDRNGVYHAVGIDDGIDWTVAATTGGAKGDLNGYTLTGTSTTAALSPKLDTDTITAFLALVA